MRRVFARLDRIEIDYLSRGTLYEIANTAVVRRFDAARCEDTWQHIRRQLLMAIREL